MNLPELPWQMLYGQLAWGTVLAALAAALWARHGRLSRTALVLLGVVCLGLQALPGTAAPAHWLALAFQWPSPLLVGLCLLSLVARWRAPSPLQAMPTELAVGLALAGSLLYLDASGWIAFGLYFDGFGPRGAAVLALILSGLCAWAIVRGVWPAHAAVLLAALTLFTVTRLPTGNLWDNLLDPWLWAWATWTALRQGQARLKQRRQQPLAG